MSKENLSRLKSGWTLNISRVSAPNTFYVESPAGEIVQISWFELEMLRRECGPGEDSAARVSANAWVHRGEPQKTTYRFTPHVK